MALDFTTGVLDSRVTIARALNTATRINSSGLVEIVNANLPRFDYNLTTLAPKGLLIEESRTNICSYSEDFLTGWGNFGGSYTPNSGTSPSGSGNATLVTNTSGGAFRYWPLVVVGTYTVSVWAKGVTGTETLRLQSAPSGTVIAHNLTTQWARYTLTYTGTWTRFDIYMDTTAQQCLLWGAQVEAGAFATSYIPTSGATATRNADAVSMTGTNFSSWFNASAGTLAVSATGYNATTVAQGGVAPAAVSLYAIAATSPYATISIVRRDAATLNSPTGYIISDAGSVGTDIQKNTVSWAGATVNAAIAWNGSTNAAFTANGLTVGTDTSYTLPTSDSLQIGRWGSEALSGYWSGHIRKVSFYPQRLTNAELQAITT